MKAADVSYSQEMVEKMKVEAFSWHVGAVPHSFSVEGNIGLGGGW